MPDQWQCHSPSGRFAGHPSPMVLVPELVQSPAPVARPPAKVVMLPCVSTLRTGPLESVKYTLPRLSTAMCVGPLSCTPVAVAEPPSPGDGHHPDGPPAPSRRTPL